MWMVDCDDQHVQDLMVSIGQTLRPLMPRPMTATATMNCACSALPSSCFCTNNPNVIGWSQPIGCDQSDYGMKREMNRVPLVSPRWNPTPEQLQALEELYRRGIITPSAQQIQSIAAKLRRFGKIEGKNVFYWFQNHKARERQKKRRQLELHAGKKLHHAADAIFEAPLRTGCSRVNIELDNVKKQSSTFSNSSTPSQDSVSLHAAVVAPEWTKLDQRELQQQGKNEHACWQLDLSSCMPSNNSDNHIIKQNVVSENNPDQENEKPLDPLNLISLLILPPKNDESRSHETKVKENLRTLLLFPIDSHGSSALRTAEEGTKDVGMAFRPNEFYEFLPMKN